MGVRVGLGFKVLWMLEVLKERVHVHDADVAVSPDAPKMPLSALALSKGGG